MPRALLQDFELANPYYAGWTVTAYVVNASFVKTASLAPIYAAQVGATQLSNPLVLDSEGKFPQPAYVDQPVVLVATDGSDSLELGVTGAMNRWRGVWQSGTLYLAGERMRHPSSPSTYICATGHTSSNFATELAALYWEEEIDADAMADAAAEGLLGTVIPVSPPEYYLRSNTAGNDLELRSPTQVRADIGAPASTAVMLLTGSQAMTGELTLSGTPAAALSAIPKSYFDLIIPKAKIHNRVGNPQFWIDQRNAFASATPTTTGMIIDRWALGISQASKLTYAGLGTVLLPPFRNHMKITTAAAYTPLATDSFAFLTAIEGLDVADFLLGTASALPFLLRFRAKASVAGTYSGSIRNSAANRSYPFSFNLAAATATTVSLIIPGDTSGTWLADTGVGMYVTFDLGCGSNFRTAANAWAAGDYRGVTGAVQMVATNAATFEITGVEVIPLPSTSLILPEFGPSSRHDDEWHCLRYYEEQFISAFIENAPGAGAVAAESVNYKRAKRTASPSLTNKVSLAATNISSGVFDFGSAYGCRYVITAAAGGAAAGIAITGIHADFF